MNWIAFPLITLTSSFCTMTYSMIMASVMMDFTGEEVITQCMTMGPYLMGLGLGSAFGDRVKGESRVRTLFGLEWLSVAILPLIPLLQIIAVFLFLNLSPAGIAIDSRTGLQVLLTLNGSLSLITGILGGAQLPLILKLKSGISEEKVLAINYLGPLFAGFAVVGMAQAALPLSFQVFVVGIVQLVGLLALIYKYENRTRRLALLLIPLSVLIGGAHLSAEMELLTVKAAYLGMKNSFRELLNVSSVVRVLRGYASVERLKTPYQTIDLYIEPPNYEYSIPGNASVYLNRKPQFDLFSTDVYHETMVYSALNLLKRQPRNVLILGAGDGLLLKEFKKVSGIEKIKMIELDEKMLEWSKTNPVMTQLNERVLEVLPANSEVIVGDGVSFLRHNLETKYDLILVDFPFPNGHELAKLYSVEFYKLVRRSLSEDGLLVLDLPLYLNAANRLSDESRVIIKSMKAAGLEKPLLYGPSASFVAVSANGKTLRFDYQRFPEGLSLASYLNFTAPFREEDITEKEWTKTPVNGMFWPRGL